MLRHAAGGWATAVGARHGGRAPPRGTGQLTAQRAGAVSAFLSVKPGARFSLPGYLSNFASLASSVGNGPQLLR